MRPNFGLYWAGGIHAEQQRGGNLVNKPGGQFVQNWSCRGATEFYCLDIFSGITFHFNSYFASWQFGGGLQCWLIARSKESGSNRTELADHH